MDALNRMKKITYNKDIQDFKELTGLDITADCLKYLKDKLPNLMNDILGHSTAKDLMLEEYDNYMMSNKSLDKIVYEQHMEEMANKEYPDLKEDELNYYCKYKDIYFEWNKLHMTEHPERGNTIGNIAKLVVDNVISIKVDTRKNYGEVRYILTCVEGDTTTIVTCYRYDKSHIRIITAWKEE